MRETLHGRLLKVMELDQILAEQIEEDDDYNQCINASGEYEVKIKLEIKAIETFLTKHTKSSPKTVQIDSRPAPSTPSFSQSGVKVKLPTLTIKKFSGNPCEYQSFIESFTEAIDKNEMIPDIQKMNYLLGFVTGEAESLIKGFRLSGESYRKALELLKSRFGNPQILTTVHMNKIIELEPVNNMANVKGLRKLYDSLETEIRNLESLNMKHTEYGPLLVPLLINKVPNELKLILSREKDFDLVSILKTFKNELEAREKVFLTQTTGENSSNERNLSAMSLYSEGGAKKQCVFCYRSGHKEQYCPIIKNPHERKRILQIERKCFVCLKGGHGSNNCRTNIKCFNCKERHNVTICFKQRHFDRENGDQIKKNKNESESETKETKDTNNRKKASKKESVEKEESEDENNSCIATGDEKSETNTILSSCQVYLQTATANVSKPNESKNKSMRILFDLGSQMSYISPDAAKELKLSSKETKDICIKTFGGRIESKTLNVYKINVATNDGPEMLEVCCNEICQPVRNNYLYDVSSLPEFRNLQVADNGLKSESRLPIDILIGADNFWRLVKGKTIRSSTGLVGTETKLGYIFSGPLDLSEISTSVVTLSAHTYNVEIVNDEFEVDKSDEFDDVDSFDAAPGEGGVCLTNLQKSLDTLENLHTELLTLSKQHAHKKEDTNFKIKHGFGD